MTEKQRQKDQAFAAKLRRERDEYLDGLPQDAAVVFEREALKKQDEKDIRRMLIEIKWSVLNQLMLHVANGEMSDSDLITLYLKVK